MGKKRVFTKMVAADAKYQPAIRIQFKGKDQSDYFSLYKVAKEDFEMPGTTLGRLIICQWLKAYREKKRNGGPGAQQMVLLLRGPRKVSAEQPAEK